jgi:hypothetical protein
MLVLVITLLPWALLVALGWWAVLRLRRRFGARSAAETPAVD